MNKYDECCDCDVSPKISKLFHREASGSGVCRGHAALVSDEAIHLSLQHPKVVG